MTFSRKKRENHASSNRSRGAGGRSRDEIKLFLRRKVDCEWRGCRSKSEKSRGGKSSQLFTLILEIFSLTSLYSRPNRTTKKACQTRKDGFLSQGAYFAYVTKKKGGLTKYHAPYLRRPCERKIKGKEAEKAHNFSALILEIFRLISSEAKPRFCERYL